MFTEVMIFAAFYAVAFVAHFLHAHFVKDGAHDAEHGHKLALYFALAAKAAHAAFHEYAVHLLVYSGYFIPSH